MTATTAIWRFDAAEDDVITLRMPKRARILSVATSDRIQHGISVWALVEPAAEQEPRRLYVIGTGVPIREWLGRFLGACVDGPMVRHVFEPAPVVGEAPLGVSAAAILRASAGPSDGDPPE